MGLSNTLLLIFAALALSCALAVVFTRHTVHAALWFVLHLLCLAAIYGLLNAPLLAVFQVMVYSGAVVVLFLFAIMILDASVLPPLPPRKTLRQALAGALVAALLFGTVLAMGLKDPKLMAMPLPDQAIEGNVPAIARLIYQYYLYPFELLSIMLLVALVGIMVLATRKLDKD
jgi:NADH-quinone oxidoreductase subunit J